MENLKYIGISKAKGVEKGELVGTIYNIKEGFTSLNSNYCLLYQTSKNEFEHDITYCENDLKIYSNGMNNIYYYEVIE